MRYLFLSVLTALVAFSSIPLVLSYEFSGEQIFRESSKGDFVIPSWIKNNAGWWADGQIDDNSFVSGIQWMISNDIIILSPTESRTGDGENSIPSWVKHTAGWWADDEIYDDTFVAALEYLIGEGIIIIEQEVEESVVQVEESVKEVEEVKEFHMRFNGPNCSFCLNWGYTDEQYHFQIETFDEYRGNALDGVTINAKIISKDGELRHDFGVLTTEDGIYNNYITIPGIEWFGDNIFSVTGEYKGIEKTIEKEFSVFNSRTSGSGCQNENPFILSSWETMPTGITLEDKGSKLFIIGSTGDDVNEFRLSIPYCLGSATFTDSFSVSGQETSPQGLAFSTDGTKMFIVGLSGKDVTEYTLGTAFDVSTATYVDEKTVDEGTNYDKPRAVDFNSDGTKMRILWSDQDAVGAYNCSAYDISSCGYDGVINDGGIDGQEANALAMAFNSDGTKMFIGGFAGDDVNEYTLSTAWDVSSRTFVDAFDISSHEGKITGLAFDDDGSRMYIVGQGGVEINTYELSGAWDVSTASHK